MKREARRGPRPNKPPMRPAVEAERMNGAAVSEQPEAAPPPDQQIVLLARQVAWLQSHCSRLIDRFCAGEIHSQRMNWEEAGQHRAAELRNIANALTAIAQGEG